METKRCTKCEKEKPIGAFTLHGRGHRVSWCKPCDAAACKDYQRRRRAGDDAYKQVLTARGASIRYQYSRGRRAGRGVPVMRGLAPHLRVLWEVSEGRCAYTGEQMVVHGYHDGVRNAVTVDRVDPALGYVAGNVVLCCSWVNRMKQDYSAADLFSYCRALLSSERLQRLQ